MKLFHKISLVNCFPLNERYKLAQYLQNRNVYNNIYYSILTIIKFFSPTITSIYFDNVINNIMHAFRLLPIRFIISIFIHQFTENFAKGII